jgi:hypothetical protein
MLSKGRIDAFLFTKNSTKHTLQKENVWHKYKVAGCVNSTDIFMAFTPAAKKHGDVKKMIDTFEQRAELLGHHTLLAQQLAKYGLD